MTRQTLRHLATTCSLLGALLCTSPSLAQNKGIGPHGKFTTRGVQCSVQDSTASSAEHAQVPGSFSAGNFGTIDLPAASDSAAYYINDHGEFAGGYGPDLEVNFSDVGFLLKKNAFKEIKFPGAVQTGAFGLNNAGDVAGTYLDTSGSIHGFQYVKGTYTTIDFPGAGLTQVDSINEAGEIAGLYYEPGSGFGQGFYLVGGTYTTIDMPGAIDTYPAGINDVGQIVGQYIDSARNYHGFLWRRGTFTTIDYPGATWSALFGINDQGEIVGEYGDGDGAVNEGFEHGYFYSDGQFLSVDVPFVGAAATWLTGINKSDQISGIYIDTAGRFYGFTAAISK